MVSGVTQLYQLGLKMIFCEALDRPAGPVGQAILDDPRSASKTPRPAQSCKQRRLEFVK
jgi:hypothetical protein